MIDGIPDGFGGFIHLVLAKGEGASFGGDDDEEDSQDERNNVQPRQAKESEPSESILKKGIRLVMLLAKGEQLGLFNSGPRQATVKTHTRTTTAGPTMVVQHQRGTKGQKPKAPKAPKPKKWTIAEIRKNRAEGKGPMNERYSAWLKDTGQTKEQAAGSKGNVEYMAWISGMSTGYFKSKGLDPSTSTIASQDDFSAYIDDQVDRHEYQAGAAKAEAAIDRGSALAKDALSSGNWEAYIVHEFDRSFAALSKTYADYVGSFGDAVALTAAIKKHDPATYGFTGKLFRELAEGIGLETGNAPEQISIRPRMTVQKQARTVTFSDSLSGEMGVAIRESGAKLKDVSVEVGGYSRIAYEGKLPEWDKVSAFLTSRREGLKGKVKGQLTHALNRIPTTESEERYTRERAERRTAAKAKRAAGEKAFNAKADLHDASKGAPTWKWKPGHRQSSILDIDVIEGGEMSMEGMEDYEDSQVILANLTDEGDGFYSYPNEEKALESLTRVLHGVANSYDEKAMDANAHFTERIEAREYRESATGLALRVSKQIQALKKSGPTFVIPLTKGAAVDMAYTTAPAPAAQWEQSGMQCAFRQSGKLGVLSICGGDLPMDFHIAASSLRKAQQYADEAIADLLVGKTPERGIFRKMDVPQSRINRG